MEALLKNESLTDLNLELNEITKAGIENILEFLKVNRSLFTIQLADNNMDKYLMENCALALANSVIEQKISREHKRIINLINENNELSSIPVVSLLLRR